MTGQANHFIGSKISLISKSEIRYEGILYALDLDEATISLAKVKSFGTEDRPTDRPIPPKDETFEFIIFRGSDIKSIDVVEPPKSSSKVTSSGLPADPAIVQVSSTYHAAVNGGSASGIHGHGSNEFVASSSAGVFNNLLNGPHHQQRSPNNNNARNNNRRNNRGNNNNNNSNNQDAGTQVGNQQQRRGRNRSTQNNNQNNNANNSGGPNNNNNNSRQRQGRGRGRGRSNQRHGSGGSSNAGGNGNGNNYPMQALQQQQQMSRNNAHVNGGGPLGGGYYFNPYMPSFGNMRGGGGFRNGPPRGGYGGPGGFGGGGRGFGGYRAGYYGPGRGRPNNNNNNNNGNNGQPIGTMPASEPAKVTFEEPFDFEKSHEELLASMAKLTVDKANKTGTGEASDGEKDETAEGAENGHAEGHGEDKPEEIVIYYVKENFFDNISCEALKKAKQMRNNRDNGRPDWRAEKKLNTETFGPMAGNNNNNGGGRRYNNGYGYNNYNNNGYRGYNNNIYRNGATYYRSGGGPGNGYNHYNNYNGYNNGGPRNGGGRSFYRGGFYDNF